MTELEIIALDSPTKTFQDIADEVGLKYDQVRYIFKKHKVKKKKSFKSVEDISEEDLKFILENCNNYSYSYFIKKYNTTERVLRRLFEKHGIQKDRVITFKPEDDWSEEEVEILKRNYQSLDNQELTELLPKRTTRAISKKLWSLSLYRNSVWSETEDDILKRYLDLPYDTIAFLLERSTRAVKHRITNLGLQKKPHVKTSIEVAIENILIKHKLPYVYNDFLTKEFRFKPDFVLPDHNVIIECQGDYFHANPLVFDDEDLNEMQKAARLKDQVKEECYTKLGYTTLFLWESDIKYNLKEIEETILDLCQPAV